MDPARRRVQDVTTNAGTIAENKYYIYNIRSYAYMLLKLKHHFSSFLLLVSVFVVHSLLFIASTSAQSITWQRTYDGPQHDDDEAYDLCQADSTNFYVVGYTGVPSTKAYVIKINQIGDTLWTRIWGFATYAYYVIQAADGGCVVAFGPGAIMARINSQGDTLWKKTFGSGRITSLKRAENGKLIVCGIDNLGGTFNGFLMIIDDAGEMYWRKEYQGTPQLDFYDVMELQQEGYIVCGRKVITGQNYSYMCKLDTAGLLIWEKVYIVNSNSYLLRIVRNASGFIFAGNTYVYPLNDSLRTFFLKTDSNCDTIVTKIFKSTRFEYLDKILLLGNNRFLTSVFTYSVFPSGARLSILDSNFVTVRSSIFSFSEGFMEIFSVIKAPGAQNGELLCAGSAYLHGPISKIDFYVARIDSGLNMPPPIGVEQISETIPEKFELKQNYPNPFNPTTSIEFDLPYDGSVKFAVYDVLGKEIYTLSEYIKAGTHRIKFDGAGLASGIYFYKLVTGSFVATKKMVLIK